MLRVKLLASVSVDLDEIPEYYALHGLGEPPSAVAGLVHELALERLSLWAREQDLKLTWFVVGRELDRAGVAARLHAAFEQGDELASHSENHRYDLVQCDAATQRAEIEQCFERLTRLTGKLRFGFRAPGYTLSDALVAELTAQRALYDSSVFACPSYMAAKATAMGWMRLRGRRSRAAAIEPQVLRAPRRAYRMGEHYFERGQGLLELPIQVTRGLRLPYIGTALALAGDRGARWLTSQVVGEPHVNLELHGIDALDVDDGVTVLGRVQPELRRSWRSKLDTFAAALAVLRDGAHELVTLAEASQRLEL